MASSPFDDCRLILGNPKNPGLFVAMSVPGLPVMGIVRKAGTPLRRSLLAALGR
jgi:hypothetical protein